MNLRAQIELHLPENLHYLLDGCEIFMKADTIHLQTTSFDAASDRWFLFGPWFGEVLKATSTKALVIADGGDYEQALSLEDCELTVRDTRREIMAQLRLELLLDTMPESIRLVLKHTSYESWGCAAGKRLHIYCSTSHAGYPQPNAVIAVLPWLQDADEFGFHEVWVTEVRAQPQKNQVLHKCNPSQLRAETVNRLNSRM